MGYKAKDFIEESFKVIQDIYVETLNNKLSYEDCVVQMCAETNYLKEKMDKYHLLLKDINIGDRVTAVFSDIGVIVGTVVMLSIEDGIKLVDCNREMCSGIYNSDPILNEDGSFEVSYIDLLFTIQRQCDILSEMSDDLLFSSIRCQKEHGNKEYENELKEEGKRRMQRWQQLLAQTTTSNSNSEI